MFHSKRQFIKASLLTHNSCSRDKKLSSFYESTPLDVFLSEKRQTPFSSVPSFRVTSDIYMLFNQQRLDRLTRTALLDHFNNMQVREPSFAALKSRMTDEDLCTLVKSRYIQSNSELLQWSNYLNSLGNEQLQQFIQRQQQQQERSKDQQGAPDNQGGSPSDNVSD